MSIKSVDLYALLSTAKKCHQKSCPEMDKGQNLDLAIENPLSRIINCHGIRHPSGSPMDRQTAAVHNSVKIYCVKPLKANNCTMSDSV